MQPMPPPQMFFNYQNNPGYPDPRAPVLSAYDPYYYATTSGPQPYFPTRNFPNVSGNVYPSTGYRPTQMQPAPPPRPFLTITQFNYQPIGYHHGQAQPAANSNIVFGPPARERRCVGDTQCRFYGTPFDLEHHPPTPCVIEPPRIIYHKSEDGSLKRNELKSDSTESFEFTIQPEQIVNALCDDKDLECMQCRSHVEPVKSNEERSSNLYCSPRIWSSDCEIMDPMRIEDDELTKFIVDGCLKAEAIAVRNQHRPCFKNIKHLCTRTRTDILKPRTTVANIHSQGIPWATKDFIFAFVRLINCWYILKGYLDDHEGSLGKIENALIPEFKECYQRWQSNNKDMVKHLINIFVNLDNGISVQNAEIFSTFNQQINNNNASPSSVSLPSERHNNNSENNIKCAPTKSSSSGKIPVHDGSAFQNKKIKNPVLQIDHHTEHKSSLENMADDKIKCSYLDSKSSVPGLLRVKDMFTNQTPANLEKNEEVVIDKNCHHHKIYMKPGSYRVPKKRQHTPAHSPTAEDNIANKMEDTNSQDSFLEETEYPAESENDPWKSALETFGPFMENVLKDSDSSSESSPSRHDYPLQNVPEQQIEIESVSKDSVIQTWVNDQHFPAISEDNRTSHSELRGNGKPSKNVFKKSSFPSKIYSKKVKDSSDPLKLHKNKVCQFPNHNKNAKKMETHSSMCFVSRKKIGLLPNVVAKFEKIIHALWNLQFAKYITFEVNVPDYYKYINKPMFLYKVMNNLKQNKYSHPYQVVHDLRTIIRNSEIYLERRPDWWFEKCLSTFSKELESQLSEKFETIDFSSVTGDPAQPPKLDATIHLINPVEEK